ncbi:MAG: GMP synthase, partial [Myxococcales bacterium]
MKALLVVKCGSTLPALRERRGDYEDWIVAGLGLEPERATVLVPPEGAELPDPDAVAAVVVTGSSAMVIARQAWSERTADWLRDVVAG